MRGPEGEIERTVRLLARLPGLGPRSARRAMLHLMKHRQDLLIPLGEALIELDKRLCACERCGNLDLSSPCALCLDQSRIGSSLAVVAEVSDLWALERSGVYNGRYHVLGGLLSPLDGLGPDDLRLSQLPGRIANEGYTEVVLALNATPEGQTTAHYIADLLAQNDLALSQLAHGVPVGGELDYLDDGTLATAFRARTAF